jgi:hypothetical protein
VIRAIRIRLALLCVLAAAACGSEQREPRRHPALIALPTLGVWAWERPEEILFPTPRPIFIAYVEHQIWLDSDNVRHRPRLQPLVISGAALVPVVHIEPSGFSPPTLTEAQAEAIVRWTVAAGRASPSKVVQLDFEARKSQRAFYRRVVDEVRRLLPQDVALSVTALASWCVGDDWLAGVAADEFVPMLFRMGTDGPQIATIWQRDRQLPRAQCRSSAGLSTSEMLPGPRMVDARIYLFSPVPWNARIFEDALRKLAS